MKLLEVSDTITYGMDPIIGVQTQSRRYPVKRTEKCPASIQPKKLRTIQTQVNNIMRIKEVITEVASAGATSAGNIATVVSPHIAIGQDRFKKSYTGTPGKSGTKAPKLPKIVQKKKPSGVAYGAHELPNTSLFGGPLKR